MVYFYMPPIKILFYLDKKTGQSPAQCWLNNLDADAREAGFARIRLLSEFGHELRRPHCENLGKGIYELRWKVNRVNYRLLYFFNGKDVVILSHGFTKQQSKVPEKEIKLAIARKRESREM